MALRKPLFMATEGYHEEMAAVDSLQLGGLAMSGDITMGNYKVTGLGAPSLDGDAATKLYVDQQVISGGKMREAVLHEEQLDNTEGVLAAAALTMQSNPVSGDTITITDGTTTRTYGAGSGGDVQYTIGATPADTMANLAAAIMADGSAVWGAYFTSDLDAIDINGVLVIIEDDNDGTVSRVYGTWATQANIQHVDFDGELDYTKKTLTNLDTSDPGGSSPNCGYRDTQANLADGELHYARNNDVIYGWDDDANVWQTMSGSASIPDATSASGGGTKGKVTADSDKGLVIASGVMEVNIDAVTLDFDATTKKIEVTGLPSLFEINGTAVGVNVTAPNLDTLTGGGGTTLHTHAHSNLSGITADDHHNRSHALDSTSDHSASGLTAGQVLRATGATTVAWQSRNHSDLAGVGADDHHNRSHAITSTSDHSESGLTAGHVLQATGATTFAWGAPPPVSAAAGVEGVYTTATDTTANGDPVYWNGANTLGLARADTDAKSHVMGVVETGGGAAPASVTVVSHGPCVSVLTSATPNTNYFLQATGGIGTSLPGGGNRVIRVGWAKNTTDLWVDIHDYGKTAASAGPST